MVRFSTGSSTIWPTSGRWSTSRIHHLLAWSAASTTRAATRPRRVRRLRVIARPPPPDPLPQGEGESSADAPPPLAGGGWGRGLCHHARQTSPDSTASAQRRTASDASVARPPPAARASSARICCRARADRRQRLARVGLDPLHWKRSRSRPTDPSVSSDSCLRIQRQRHRRLQRRPERVGPARLLDRHGDAPADRADRLPSRGQRVIPPLRRQRREKLQVHAVALRRTAHTTPPRR